MTTRKAFIAASALAAASPLAARAASPQPSPASTAPETTKLAFDLDAFHAVLDKAATHKHCFASVRIAGAEVFSAMRNTLNAYRDTGTPLSDVFPVAVLYHGLSIALAFDDTIWNEDLLPFARNPHFAREDAAKDLLSAITPSTQGNPYLRRQGGEWDSSIPSLIADVGARFFICNNAAQGYANYLAVALKKKPVDIYDRLVRHLVPNATLVPAGVWAVHAIQERRFTLLQTSL